MKEVNKLVPYLDQEQGFPGRTVSKPLGGNLSEDCVAAAQEIRMVVGNDIREREDQSL